MGRICIRARDLLFNRYAIPAFVLGHFSTMLIWEGLEVALWCAPHAHCHITEDIYGLYQDDVWQALMGFVGSLGESRYTSLSLFKQLQQDRRRVEGRGNLSERLG